VSAELPIVPGGFHCVLVDPPWRYSQALGREENGDTTRGGVPYETMSEAEITALPVRDVVAEDCQLYLWCPNSFVEEAYRIARAWSFKPILPITWVKRRPGGPLQIGLGYHFRGASEQLLYAVRGHPRSKMTGPHGTTGKAWSTVIEAPRREHSRKPDEAYVMIEDVSEPPRLEMFARPPHRANWTVWGAQAGGPVQNSLDGPEE
jgi:N6-adenosine-specific RNA methylase IME4